MSTGSPLVVDLLIAVRGVPAVAGAPAPIRRLGPLLAAVLVEPA